MPDARMADLVRSATLIVSELLAVRRDEEVLLICDTATDLRMAEALAGAVQARGAEYTIAIIPSRPEQRGNSLTAFVERGLPAVDVVIGLTAASGAPTYNKKIVELLEQRKTRNMSMVMRNVDNWTRGGATADYNEILQSARYLKNVWEKAESITVRTARGTNLRATIKNEKVIIESGFATEPGQEAAFSDGEVSQMPNEGSASGVIVVDGSICHLGTPREPLQLLVEAGKVVEVLGSGPEARRLKEILATVPGADNIAEIGIGLNPKSRQSGDFEEEKKRAGNVHIALGNNLFYGGTVDSEVHMDMVIYEATVCLDGRPVVEKGRLVFDPAARGPDQCFEAPLGAGEGHEIGG